MRHLLIFVFCVTFFFGVYHDGNSDSWNKFRGSPDNKGWRFVNGPESPELKWSYEWIYYLHPGNEFDLNSSPVIGSDGTIYYGAEVLYAFDQDGNVKWTFDPDPASDTDTIPSTPLITDNNEIFFGTWNGYFYKIKVEDNKPIFLWYFYTTRGIESSPALSSDKTFIYFGANDKNFYALKASSGELLWKKKLDDEVRSSPCVDENDKIYVGSCDGNVYALSRYGQVLWTVDTGDWVTSTGAINKLLVMKDDDIGFVDDLTQSASKQYLYIGSWDTSLLCIDTETAGVVWDAYVANTVRSGIGVGLNGMIYIPAFNYYLEGYAPYGYRKFRYGTHNVVFSSPAVDYNDNVYFGGKDGYLYSLDKDGNLRWSYNSVDLNAGIDTGNDYFSGIVSSPALDEDGTIYFASYEPVGMNQFRIKFYALGPGSEPETARSALSISTGTDYLRAFISFANPAEEVKLDLYIAYQNPEGEIFFFPESKDAVPLRITIPEKYRSPSVEFYRIKREELFVGYEYKFFVALTEPGTLNIVGTISSESYIHNVD